MCVHILIFFKHTNVNQKDPDVSNTLETSGSFFQMIRIKSNIDFSKKSFATYNRQNPNSTLKIPKRTIYLNLPDIRWHIV